MDWFFDVIIFGFLIIDAAAITYLIWRVEHRHRHVFDALILAAIVAWCVIFYGSFIEPQRIVVSEANIELHPNATRHLHAILVSDIHAGRYKGPWFVERLKHTILETHPDVVLLAGDFVMKHGADAVFLESFRDMTAVYPTYAVMGNHDYHLWGSKTRPNNENAQEVQDYLESFGINVLKNEGIAFRDELWIGGIDEYWTHAYSVQKAVEGRSEDMPTILLTHNPDIVTKLQPTDNIDIVLAGHTHGGQIRLPLIGPVPELPDQLGREYDKGLFSYKGTQLYITSGAGESGPRARLFNPPEIVSLTIRY